MNDEKYGKRYIKKSLPGEDFTRISNLVITDDSLGHGAFRLYYLLANIPDGKRFSDSELRDGIGIKQTTLASWKKVLCEKDLILLDREGTKEYNLYVGSSRHPASKVKEYWEKDDE